MWTVPNLTIRPISRTPFGFDPQGQFVSDVNGQAVRAIYEALRESLRLHLSNDPALPQALEAASRAWLEALNQSSFEQHSINEAWVKGTAHLYSSEFFFLADYYARQLTPNSELYLQELVKRLLPSAFKTVGTHLPFHLAYQSRSSLFQNIMPLDLRLIRQTRQSAVIEWHATSSTTKVAPDYRADFFKQTRELLRQTYYDLPSLLKDVAPATVKETILPEQVVRWEIEWVRGVLLLPRYLLIGAVLSVVLLVAAFASQLPILAYIALIPILAGIAWDVIQYQSEQIKLKENTLLDQLTYSQMQNVELSAAYASLRQVSSAQEQQSRDFGSIREAIIRLGSNLDRKSLLKQLIDICTQRLAFDRALILLRNEDENTLVFGEISHLPQKSDDVSRLQSLRVELNREDANLAQDPLFSHWFEGEGVIVNQPNVYFKSRLNWLLAMLEFNQFYSVPLLLGQEFLGVLVVDHSVKRQPISPQSRTLVDSLATVMAVTLENAHLYTLQDVKLRESIKDLQTMSIIDRDLLENLELQEVLDLLLDWALRYSGARFAAVMLADVQAQIARIALVYGCEESQLPGGQLNYPLPLARAGITGRAVRERKTIRLTNSQDDPDYLAIMPNAQSTLAVPIRFRGNMIGAMTLETDRGEFTPEHQVFMERLAARAGLALENARLFTESRQERDKLSAILRQTSDAVVVVGETQELILLNDAAHRLFNLRHQTEQYLGRHFNIVLNNPDFAKFYHHVTQEDPKALKGELTITERTYDGLVARVEGVGHVFLLHDVTPFKELDKLKNQLVASVSHDLKNPLAIIRGYADLIEMSIPPSDKTSGYLHKIVYSVDNTRELIDNILDLAKIESGVTLTLNALHLPDLILRSENEVAFRATEKGIQFAHEYDEPVPLVMADSWRMQQILNNLVGNAVKYTLNASTITIHLLNQGKFLKVAIQDQGIGIAEDQLSSVWERFVRVRTAVTKNIEGTGLGLAIVRSLVEAHGGQVGLESQEGVGSTFWFTVPIAQRQLG